MYRGNDRPRIAAAVFVPLVLGILLLCGSTAFAEQTVRMGYFEYANMCVGASEGSLKSGYVYDIMQKIASYTGWRYEYDYGTYAEEYELLKNGEIDILPYTNWNEQRSREVLFSKDPIIEEQYFLAARAEDSSLSGGDPASLNGKTIATVVGADQNTILTDFLSENGVEAEIVYYNTPELSWDALENGEADAAVFSNISYRSAVDWNVFCTFGSKPTYIAVSRGNESLLADLDMAFETLMQTNPTFVSQLEANVYSGNPAMICLSEKEKEWLKEHDTIRMGYLKETNPVYVRQNEEGECTGFLTELIGKILTALRVEPAIDYIGYATAEEMGEALLAHEVDIVFPFYPSFTHSEEYGFTNTNALTESIMAVVYKAGTPLSSVMDTLAVESSALTRYYLEKHYPESRVVVADNIDEAIRLLRTNAVTGFVGKTNDTIRMIQTFADLEEMTLSEGYETCFAANLEDSSLIVTLNRGISMIPKSEVSAMASNNTPAVSIDLIDYVLTHTESMILVILIPLFLIGLALALTTTNRLRKKALSANAAKTKFLFNMSHDIRTPMNAILGYTDIGLRHIEDIERSRDCYKKIKSAGGHLLNLINDILEMSRIESGKLELAENPVDIREIIECVKQMGLALAIPKSIQYTVEVGEIRNPYILADEVHINEVLINLVSNAIKYTQEGGTVCFRTEQIEEGPNGKIGFRFVIKDTGIGMSEEFQKHLFESFSRENSATVSRQEGAGLGLSIVKRIVDLSGGTIDVSSRKGMGSEFIVKMTFRKLDESSEKAYRAEQERYAAVDSDKQLTGSRILLVEDNEMNREIATEILEEAGLRVETAEDGEIAVNRVNEKGVGYYDFILMDIQMPVMDGYQATAEIRKLPDGGTVPIIALSANAFREDIELSLASGMNAHVSKPINVRVLFETMHNLRNRAKNSG